MKIKDVMLCSFPNWYEKFANITAKSVFLALPEGFVPYLLKDGIILPKGEEPLSYSNVSDSDNSEVDWDSSEADEPEAPDFPAFNNEIKKSIEILGGRVFPKLNWSSPRDAAWIALNNSCSCSSVSDVYLLLKSSDFIVHDLTAPFKYCDDSISNNERTPCAAAPVETFYLVLREWMEIDPSGEFRCFVKDGTLIGISQREHSLYFDHIGHQRDNITRDIVSFFIEHIQFKFPCSDYVFDVFREKKDIVHLIDFNPFGRMTDSLLFDWLELIDGTFTMGDQSIPEFRYVCQNHGVQPRPFSYHAIPKDIVDISTGEDSFKLVDLMKLKINEQNENSSSDDESNHVNSKS